MKLHFRTQGSGEPLVVLHGLFGSLNNWRTLSSRLADHHLVYSVDQRNHGESPHDSEMSYPLLAGDVAGLMEDEEVTSASLIGHSMGGKTGMQLALTYPERVRRLVVVDIAPRAYPRGHDDILDALCSLDMDQIMRREDADRFLAHRLHNPSVRAFLLTNLKRIDSGKYQWRINLDAIRNNYDLLIGSILPGNEAFYGPVLFVIGGRSDYVRPEDREEIQRMFPKATFITIPEAGHWVHSDAPEQLLNAITEFLQ